MEYMYDDALWEIDSEETIRFKQEAFNQRCRTYETILNSCSARFPKRFVKQYTESFYFHDYRIQSILFCGEYPASVARTITDGQNVFSVIYERVTTFRCGIADALYSTDIVYNEILPCGNNAFSHEFQLSYQNSKMLIVFRRLRFRRLHK